MRRLFIGWLVALAACTSEPPTAVPPSTAETTTTTEAEPTSQPSSTPAPTTTTVPPTQTEALLAAIREIDTDGPVRVGLVAHRASVLPEGRTIDVLTTADGIELVRIFAPEHGLAGDADAGELVDDGTEPLTGVPVISLYGSTRSPSRAQVDDLDAVIYDLQDVGVRAYTYISTMGKVVEQAGRSGAPIIVVDRPNPQGTIVDGPILREGLTSFISPYAIPPAYGLSSGALATLIVGEGFVGGEIDLRIIGPTAALSDPWIPPSPNLPTLESTWLYPAVVAFEATALSEGRGTDTPFSLIGGPGADVEAVLATTGGRQLIGLDVVATDFTPQDIPNMAVNPRFEGQTIPGIKLTTNGPLGDPLRVTVELLDAFMDASPNRAGVIDRPDVFDRLVGDPAIRLALIADTAPSDIADLWAEDVETFTTIADRYRTG